MGLSLQQRNKQLGGQYAEAHLYDRVTKPKLDGTGACVVFLAPSALGYASLCFYLLEEKKTPLWLNRYIQVSV